MPMRITTIGAGAMSTLGGPVLAAACGRRVVARDADPTWLLLQRARDGVYALCGEVVATASAVQNFYDAHDGMFHAKASPRRPWYNQACDTPQRPAGGRVQDVAFAPLCRDQAGRARRPVASAPR